MTPRVNYNQALEVAVQYASQNGLTLQEICDALVLQIASVVGPAKRKEPGIDLDALLEIVRHKLDVQTSAFQHNVSPGVRGLPALPAPQPRPRPPKEQA